jgi:sugar lactone lactonase YvrE
MMQVEVVCRPANLLGESPIWCVRTRRLYWVDGRAPTLHVLDTATRAEQSHALPETTGSICLCEDGSLLVAMVSGIFRLSGDGVVGERIATPQPNHPDNRFNDGRCDRAGRFYTGTLNDKQRIPTGALWRLGPGGDFTALFDEIIVPNGLAFSPDNRRMYFADTYRQLIEVFDYDIDAGALGKRRVFADLAGGVGRPDGSAVDAEGCLWNAEYAGSRVVRYTPEGQIDRIIAMPVSQPTCCAFGGAHLDELYITSARQRLTPEQLAGEPLAGSLFVLRPGVQGLPEGRYGGA